MLRSVQDSTLIGTRAPEFWSNPDKTYGQNNSKTLRTTVQRWGVQLVRASRRSCAQSKQGYETPRAQWNLSQGQRGITTFLFFPLTIPPPCSLSHVQPHCLTHMSPPQGTQTQWLRSNPSADRYDNSYTACFHMVLTLSLTGCNYRDGPRLHAHSGAARWARVVLKKNK